MSTVTGKRLLWVIPFALALLSGCAATKQYTLHHTLEERPETAPRKLLVLPVSVPMYEMSAGGLREEVPAWTEQVQGNVDAAVRKHLAGHGDIQLVGMPKLTPAQLRAVSEHRALYDRVAETASLMTRFGGPGWAHKREHFDYTIGDGLSFLAKASGADAALIVVGEDVASSSGRKAAIVLGAIMGVGLSGGHSYLSSGLVDLKTGNILWFNYAVSSGSADLRVPADSEAMIAQTLKDLPSRDSDVIRQVSR